MATGCCITIGDIEELRNIVSDLKTNLYDWISEKQTTKEIFDSAAAGLDTNHEASISLGALSVSQTNTNVVSSAESLSVFGSILGL